MANRINRISIDSKILGGKPVIKGTRISIEFIIELLASGMSVEEIIKEYPHLKKEDRSEEHTSELQSQR